MLGVVGGRVGEEAYLYAFTQLGKVFNACIGGKISRFPPTLFLRGEEAVHVLFFQAGDDLLGGWVGGWVGG